MSALGVALVLASAVCHATWNLFAKRAEAGGAAFVWLMATAGAALYAPAAAVVFLVVRHGHVTGAQGIAFAGSAVLHAVYFSVLQRGYREGDLSVVYPVARGTGPLLASVGAVVLLGERPSPLGGAGIALICVGIFLLGLPDRTAAPRSAAAARRNRAAHTGFLFGLLTGVLIAVYTVWDGHAVADLHAAPVLLMWTDDFGRFVLLAPLVARRADLVRETWAEHRWRVLGGGLLSPLSYILVLTALTFSPVTAVAPLRECSVLLGVLFGARLLAEGGVKRRLAASAAVVAGAAAVALG